MGGQAKESSGFLVCAFVLAVGGLALWGSWREAWAQGELSSSAQIVLEVGLEWGSEGVQAVGSATVQRGGWALQARLTEPLKGIGGRRWQLSESLKIETWSFTLRIEAGEHATARLQFGAAHQWNWGQVQAQLTHRALAGWQVGLSGQGRLRTAWGLEVEGRIQLQGGSLRGVRVTEWEAKGRWTEATGPFSVNLQGQVSRSLGWRPFEVVISYSHGEYTLSSAIQVDPLLRTWKNAVVSLNRSWRDTPFAAGVWEGTIAVNFTVNRGWEEVSLGLSRQWGIIGERVRLSSAIGPSGWQGMHAEAMLFPPFSATPWQGRMSWDLSGLSYLFLTGSLQSSKWQWSWTVMGGGLWDVETQGRWQSGGTLLQATLRWNSGIGLQNAGIQARLYLPVDLR